MTKNGRIGNTKFKMTHSGWQAFQHPGPRSLIQGLSLLNNLNYAVNKKHLLKGQSGEKFLVF